MESTLITVRFWAGARQAAGVSEITCQGSDAPSLSVVVQRALAAVDPERRDQLCRVVAACSVLVEGQGVAGREPDEVRVAAGATVELLPPFAGG